MRSAHYIGIALAIAAALFLGGMYTGAKSVTCPQADHSAIDSLTRAAEMHEAAATQFALERDAVTAMLDSATRARKPIPIRLHDALRRSLGDPLLDRIERLDASPIPTDSL